MYYLSNIVKKTLLDKTYDNFLSNTKWHIAIALDMGNNLRNRG